MPAMYEIYNNFADNYDELVNAEDYQKNLNKYLLNEFNWENVKVLELGVGTGRVTKIYADKVEKVFAFDRALHMMDKAKKKLARYSDKIVFEYCDNNSVSVLAEKVDIFIEGWSLFHTLSDNYEEYEKTFDKMVTAIKQNVKENGDIILIETLGTLEDKPLDSGFMAEYHNILENKYFFKRKIIRTDYKFRNSKEAARIMGFFFGDMMKENIAKKDISVIPEFTGIWSLKNL